MEEAEKLKEGDIKTLKHEKLKAQEDKIKILEVQKDFQMEEVLRIIQGVIGIFGICLFIGAAIMIIGFCDIYDYRPSCYCLPSPYLVINNYIVLATLIIEAILISTMLFLERKIRKFNYLNSNA